MRAWNPESPNWRTVNRWLWIALPEDSRQNVHLAFLLARSREQKVVERVFRFLQRELRREVWDHQLSRPSRIPRELKPSRVARRTEAETKRARLRRAALDLSAEFRHARAVAGMVAARANRN